MHTYTTFTSELISVAADFQLVSHPFTFAGEATTHISDSRLEKRSRVGRFGARFTAQARPPQTSCTRTVVLQNWSAYIKRAFIPFCLE